MSASSRMTPSGWRVLAVKAILRSSAQPRAASRTLNVSIEIERCDRRLRAAKRVATRTSSRFREACHSSLLYRRRQPSFAPRNLRARHRARSGPRVAAGTRCPSRREAALACAKMARPSVRRRLVNANTLSNLRRTCHLRARSGKNCRLDEQLGAFCAEFGKVQEYR